MIEMGLKACSIGSVFTFASNVMLQIYQGLNIYGNIKNTMECIDTIHKAYYYFHQHITIPLSSTYSPSTPTPSPSL